MTKSLLLMAPLLCAAASAFHVGSPAASSVRSRTTFRVYAEAEPSPDAEADGEPAASGQDDDILNSPAFLSRKADVLRSDIEELEGQITEASAQLEEGKAEWEPQIEKLQKEYLNIQDRLSKQSKESGGAATIEVVRSMLDVLDNFDRAFQAVTAASDEEKSIEAAYQGTRDMILKVFTDLGVSEVETVGAEFDYEVHQAVMQIPSEYEEGIVCGELAKGFMLDDKLIRAAMVSVSA